MPTITFDVPDGVLSALRLSPTEFVKEMRRLPQVSAHRGRPGDRFRLSGWPGWRPRANLCLLARTRGAAVNKEEKLEPHRYLSGVEFRQRVEAVVEAFTAMRHDLDQERRAAERQWARRSRQIDAVTFNVSGMYGDPQGLVPAPQDRRSPPRMRDDRISDSFDWANSLIIGTAATPITTPSVSQCH
jgi:hypothetical protein